MARYQPGHYIFAELRVGGIKALADPWKACSNRWCRRSCRHHTGALGRHSPRSCARILQGPKPGHGARDSSQVSACLVSSTALLRHCRKTAASRVTSGHMLPECSDEVTHIVHPVLQHVSAASLTAGLPKCPLLCRMGSGAWSRFTAMLPVPANLGALAHSSSFSWRDPCPSSHSRALHKTVYRVVLLDSLDVTI